MAPLSIGQLAREAGVGVETIRYYERSGLLEDPPRSEAGYRKYSSDDVSRLLFIRRAKELGFSLKEIAELLELRDRPQTNCGAVQGAAETKIESIDGKIRDLRRIRSALSELIGACESREPTNPCPILAQLDDLGRPES